MMISYAQGFEDVLLERVFRDVANGFYVDIGAHHPSTGSVTKHFYDRGWHGINVEPSSSFEAIAQERSRDVNLQIAISDKSGKGVLYEHPTDPGTTTLNPQVVDTLQHCIGRRVSRQIEMRTLQQVLRDHAVEHIDFLSVDVEGHEKEVLSGNDWEKFRPRVLVVESTIPYTNTLCHQTWEPLLLDANYLFAYFDGINRFYVRGEDAGLKKHFAVPVNPLDYFVSAETVHLREQALRNRTVVSRFTARVAELEQEAAANRDFANAQKIKFEATQAELQKTCADRETIQSELRSACEEIDATRTDLQSAHEQIKSVQAELESTREELAAVRSRLESVPENGKPVTAASAFDDKGAEIIDHGDTEANATSSNGSPHPKSLEPLEQKIRLCEEELEATQKELEWRRGQVESYEKDLAHRASEVQSLRAALEDKEANYQWMTRRTGPKSLAAGLKVARKIHWLTRR
jgi:FkbM family methyltransferase